MLACRGKDRRRAGLSRRRRHRESAQHRDRASAGRRQAHQDLVHRRPGRPKGLRPRQDRSDHLPGRNTIRRWRRKRRTKRSSPTPSSISSATRRLAATNAINKQQLDTQKAMVSQLEAQVQLDQAAIDNARAILSYTDVVAPIAGRTGIRLVDEGNIVHASDATGIVILTQLRPISVFFNLPQQNLPDSTRAGRRRRCRSTRSAPDGKTRARQRQGHGDRQPGRSDHRHGEAQGRISQHRTCSSGPASSSMCGC